ncbi:MAG: FAD-dependent oxidoreductase [Spirochaetales bacterium]|nr:FAD-dependent oxidoreductase [Spirochaetales bacterium]
MNHEIKEITEKEYRQAINSSPNVVVDFYSTECPPCEALAPKYHYFADLFGKEVLFLKIFRQGNRKLAEELGVKSSPTLVFYKNGKEAGKRLSGAILKSSIQEEIKSVYGLEAPFKNTAREHIECDVCIIGGGPAGLTAAVYSSRAKLKTIVLEKGTPGGYVNTTHMVANYPGTGKDINGFMLGHLMTEQAKSNEAAVHMACEIESVDLEKKVINADFDKTIKAKAIIIATGSKPRLLNLPGELEYQGKGISYCATCDGAFYEGKDIAVIGGGNSALEESLFLSQYAKKITIIHQFDEFQANKRAVAEVTANPRMKFMLSHEPRGFFGNGQFEQVEVEDLKTGKRSFVKTDGVFIFTGFAPNTDAFPDAFEKDKYGYIITDELMATNIPGVYAAGDVRSKKYRQITTAVADGTIAALEVEKYIRHGH